tara:strand:- start:66 stop:233 length:168 start_codon:yes stop_codon:yes gene_type:complete
MKQEKELNSVVYTRVPVLKVAIHEPTPKEEYFLISSEALDCELILACIIAKNIVA